MYIAIHYPQEKMNYFMFDETAPGMIQTLRCFVEYVQTYRGSRDFSRTMLRNHAGTLNRLALLGLESRYVTTDQWHAVFRLMGVKYPKGRGRSRLAALGNTAFALAVPYELHDRLENLRKHPGKRTYSDPLAAYAADVGMGDALPNWARCLDDFDDNWSLNWLPRVTATDVLFNRDNMNRLVVISAGYTALTRYEWCVGYPTSNIFDDPQRVIYDGHRRYESMIQSMGLAELDRKTWDCYVLKDVAKNIQEAMSWNW